MKDLRTAWSGEHGALAHDDRSDIPRAMRDLAALATLPSVWVNGDARQSIQNLTDVLRAALRAFTVCVRVELPDGGQFETAASEGLSNRRNHTLDTAELLDAVEPGSTELIEIGKFNGSGPLNALPVPIFFEGSQIGYFIACYREPALPSASDRLLLHVAASQVMLLLQRHKDQEERLARELAEDRLRRAEHHYQQLVQSLPAAVYTCDNQGRLTLYNEAAVALWGRRPKIGEDKWCGSWKIFKTDGRPLALEDCPMAVAIREGRSVRGEEIVVERPDGTRAFVLPHPDPIRDESGAIVGAVNMLVVVDEIKRIEQALRSSEARLQSLLNLMPAAVYACDAAGRITFYNRSAAELWGREPALNDDQQKFCAAFRCWFNGKVLAPEDTPMAIAAQEGKSFRNLEPVFERSDGVRVPVLINIDPIFDAGGKPAGAIHVFQDVSALKQVQAELGRKNHQLAAFLETAVLGLHRVGPDGIIQWANAAEMRMLGYTAEEYIGHHIAEFHADGPVIDNILERLTCGETLHECEARLRCRDGTIKHVLIDSSVLWENGEFIHTQCFTRDVTDRRRAEEELRKNQAQLKAELADTRLLHEISATLICENDSHVLYNKILEAAVRIMRSEMGSMQMYDPKEDALRLLAWHGFGPDFGEVFKWVRPETKTCCSLARRMGKRAIVPDIETCEFFAGDPALEGHRAAGIRAAQSTPLLSRTGKLVGMISTHWAQPHQPSERDLRLLDILARQGADLLERRQAEEALHKRGERLQLLSETLGQLLSARHPDAIVRELFPKVAAHMGADTYFNFMVNETGDALELHSCAGIPEETARAISRLEFGQAICGTVAQTRQPIHATDVQHSDFDKAQLVRAFGIQCYACNPLIAGERLLGTLSFASRTRTAFDPDELQFLRIISQYTAVALDRLKSAEKLRDSEERFRAVVDNSTTVIYVKDSNGKYLLINECFERLFHITEDKILGKTDFDIFSVETAQQFRDNDLAVLRSGEPIEIEEVAPHDDGPHTYISIKFPLRKLDGSIYAVAGISTDITARKRAEEGAARLAALVEHSDDAIFSTDLDGIIKSWNRGAERLYGYTAEEATGQPVTMLVPENRREEESTIFDRIRQARTVENYETVRRRKNGALLDVSLTVSPVTDANGNVIAVSKVARDITDELRAKEKLELTVAERTASLRAAVAQMEEFSYTVSHDLRAPLRGMRVYTDALLQDFAAALPPQASHYLKRISVNANRLDKMILDVLTFSRLAKDEQHLERVHVDKLARQIVEQYPGMQAPEARIEIEPLHDLWGHEPSLTQALSNLLNNAVKFVAPGATPTVKVWSERRGARVRIWISDNGIGIDPKYHHRLFNMFERVHPNLKYEGTGVGLAIVRKAMERMGGNVGMESDGSNGSRFWIEADAADGK